jgi:uncharacterized protein
MRCDNLENESHKKMFYDLVKDIIENPEFIKRKKYIHHYNETLYDHLLKVAYDVYLVAIKKNYDYKRAVYGAILHDFYDRDDKSAAIRQPLFSKHGFQHAKRAANNAKKFFPNIVDEKVYRIIETHMFPMNMKIPESKEAWLVTLIDKKDSLAYLKHPAKRKRRR